MRDALAGLDRAREHDGPTSGWLTTCAPISPRPCTRLTVPGGKPASGSSCMNMLAQMGAYSDGFHTVVQPSASPYTSGMPAMSTGKFHG